MSRALSAPPDGSGGTRDPLPCPIFRPCHIALPFHQAVIDLRCIAVETERPATQAGVRPMVLRGSNDHDGKYRGKHRQVAPERSP